MTIGKEGLEKLGRSRVAVFGVGGVGGYVAEALVRSAIGAIDLIDNDTVSISNLNRQIIERFLDINPECKINAIRCFFTSETSSQFDFLSYDYVVDCIDTVSGKIQIVMQAKQAGVPVICSMGAGNKMNPALFEVADIYQTSVCPLARVMRRELKERGVEKLKVVYSKEKPIQPQYTEDELQQMMVAGAKRAPGSNAFVPATAGLLIASEVVKDLLLKA